MGFVRIIALSFCDEVKSDCLGRAKAGCNLRSRPLVASFGWHDPVRVMRTTRRKPAIGIWGERRGGLTLSTPVRAARVGGGSGEGAERLTRARGGSRRGRAERPPRSRRRRPERVQGQAASSPCPWSPEGCGASLWSVGRTPGGAGGAASDDPAEGGRRGVEPPPGPAEGAGFGAGPRRTMQVERMRRKRRSATCLVSNLVAVPRDHRLAGFFVLPFRGPAHLQASTRGVPADVDPEQ